MSTPKVSVIVPVYNGARYLGEAIESVLNQTFQDFELVVVSDASPDDSADVVRQFSDQRIRYLEHAQNRGSIAARNTGIEASRGDIVVFLDQDDVFHAEKLHTHVEFLARNPDIGLSYNSRFELLNESSRLIRTLWRPPRSVVLGDMVMGFPFGPSEMVIRRGGCFCGPFP